MDNHFNGFPPTASPNLSAQQTSQLRSDEAFAAARLEGYAKTIEMVQGGLGELNPNLKVGENERGAGTGPAPSSSDFYG